MIQMQFSHECDRCVYLGCFWGYDLYWCKQDGTPSVTARFGNGSEDVEFCTAAYATAKRPALAEARERAVQRGLDCGV